MGKFKYVRSVVVVILSFSFSLPAAGESSANLNQAREQVSSVFAHQLASDFSQLKSSAEMVAYLFEGRSIEEKNEILKIAQSSEVLPQIQIDEGNWIFSLGEESLRIDVSQAYKGRFVIEGMVFTVDPKAPVKMQSEILRKKLSDHLNPKHSLFSFFISNAYAQGKGKASIIGKGGKAYKRALTADELKAIAEEERKSKSVLGKTGNAITKHPIVSLFVVGGTMKLVELIQVSMANGFGTKICTVFDNSPEVEPSQREVDTALFCPDYKKNKKTSLEKARKEKEKLDAEAKIEAEKKKKELKEKEEKAPDITAAATAEELKKFEVEGVSLTTIRKSCPHERKDGNVQSSIMKITSKAEGEEAIDLLLLEGTREDGKLTEVRVSEYVRKKRGALIAIYKYEDSKLARLALPSKGRDRNKVPFEEVSAIEELPTTHPRYNDQKLQKAIHQKFQLSYLACADEEANAKGNKAAEAAGVKGLPPAPVKKDQPAPGKATGAE